MHNIILSVAYCCNCTCNVLITCVLKSSHINCLIRSLFLNPSIVVQALRLCIIPFSGYIDNWVLVIDIIGLFNYEMAFAQPIAKVCQRMANMMHQCDDTFATWMSKF